MPVCTEKKHRFQDYFFFDIPNSTILLEKQVDFVFNGRPMLFTTQRCKVPALTMKNCRLYACRNTKILLFLPFITGFRTRRNLTTGNTDVFSSIQRTHQYQDHYPPSLRRTSTYAPEVFQLFKPRIPLQIKTVLSNI